ncbi:MAG: TonB-dependent receptor [Sphingobacteriaceae bacterium]|nr:MAG: TonB-dependent receptor [Sphingobacteriaceae bacterium]
MNITQEKVDNLNTILKININPEDYTPRVDKAIKDQAKKAKLPGFRPGMVPAAHIKKMYGKSILVDEINNLLSDTLNSYIDEQKLEVLGQPLPKVDESKEYNWDFADNFEFNYEVGLKADWFNKRLLTTVALFRADQQNLGTYAGTTSDAQSYYVGQDVNSKGIEAEITGQIGDFTRVVLGFTKLKLEDQQGVDTYIGIPRETVNLVVSTKLPQYTAITLGGSAKWQSDTAHLDDVVGVMLRQDSYATLNLFASWDLNERTQLKLNINNVTDEKYLTSLVNVGYYAAPRTLSASLKVEF